MTLLETSRTHLRAPTIEDTPVLNRLFGDAHLMTYINEGRAFSKVEVEEMSKAMISHHAKTGFGPSIWIMKQGHALGSSQDEEIIGIAGLRHMTDDGPIDLGFALFEPYWGKGFATEVSIALLAQGFNHYKFDKIQARCSPGNEASKKILRKIGMDFVELGTHRGMATEFYSIEKRNFHPSFQ